MTTANSNASTRPSTTAAVEAAQAVIGQPRQVRAALPWVTVPGGNVSVTSSAERLFGEIAQHKRLFYQSGFVVELVDEDAGPVIHIVDAAAAVSRFERYVNFAKQRRGDESHLDRTTITESVAKIYLKSEAARELLPKLKGISNCPMIYEVNGQLHQTEQGYNEQLGLYVTAQDVETNFPIQDAVGLLDATLGNFNFLTPGDRSRAIASYLTPALKLGGFIRDRVPIEVAEANASQSGKTYRQKMVAAIYNQKLAVVTKKTGGVGSMEETFADHLVKGRAFIQFDNVRGKLESQMFESCLTSDGVFTARVPYHGSMPVDPSRFMIYITSNGFEATKDLLNRASFVRIQKRDAGCNFPDYGGLDLLGYMRSIQPLLIGAVFRVIDEWHGQGKPRTNETRHDFREWCQILDWIVQNIFHLAPLMDGHDGARLRAANPSLSFLRTLSLALASRRALDQALTAAAISQICLEESIDIPGVNMEEQTVEQAPMQIGRIMRPLFNDGETVTFDEFRVERRAEQRTSNEGNNFESYSYVFQLTTPPAPPLPTPPDNVPPSPVQPSTPATPCVAS